jgi:hypothetical protein
MRKLLRYMRKVISYFNWVFKSGDMPEVIKHIIIKWTGKKYRLDTLIETGTAYGQTLKSVRRWFKYIYSVELSQSLYIHSFEKFWKYKHINIFPGDCVEVLPRLLKEIDRPCLFWLDAHWSGDGTAKGKQDDPALDELDIIFKSKYNHIILMDDCMYMLSAIEKKAVKAERIVSTIGSIIKVEM